MQSRRMIEPPKVMVGGDRFRISYSDWLKTQPTGHYIEMNWPSVESRQKITCEVQRVFAASQVIGYVCIRVDCKRAESNGREFVLFSDIPSLENLAESQSP